MVQEFVACLFDHTGNMIAKWANGGFVCYCVNVKHSVVALSCVPISESPLILWKPAMTDKSGSRPSVFNVTSVSRIPSQVRGMSCCWSQFVRNNNMDNNPTIRDLYPHFTDEELVEAEDTLDRYIMLVLHICERMESESEWSRTYLSDN